MTTTAPRWLTAYTATLTGGIGDLRLLGTRAIPRHHHCGRLVLVGYDAPAMAGLAVVDPYRLTAALEHAAVILARPTYRLWGHPGHYELTARTPVHPPYPNLASADTVPVVAAHQCDAPPLSTLPLPTAAHRGGHPDDPPF